MKIRGNAHHVAEKYLQLARDAHTGGDPVAAENYLQHAEHYFRLIAAAQAAQALAQSGQQRPPGEDENDMDDDGDFDALSDRFASPAERQNRLSSSRSKDFNRNRAPRRTPRSRSPTDRLTRPSVRAATIEEALRPGRIVRATDFRTEVRDPIARSKTATRVIATIEMDATVVPGISGPIAILSRRVNAAADAAAPGPSLLHNGEPEDPIIRIRLMGAPSPETVASPTACRDA